MARGSDNLLFGSLVVNKENIYYQEERSNNLRRQVDLLFADLEAEQYDRFLLRLETDKKGLDNYPFFSLLFQKIVAHSDYEKIVAQDIFPKRAKGLKREKDRVAWMTRTLVSQGLEEVLLSETSSKEFKKAYLHDLLQSNQALVLSSLVYSSSGPLAQSARKVLAAQSLSGLGPVELETIFRSDPDLSRQLFLRQIFSLLHRASDDSVWKTRPAYAILQRKPYDLRRQTIHITDGDRVLCRDSRVDRHKQIRIEYGDWNDGYYAGKLNACSSCKSKVGASLLARLQEEDKSEQAFYFGQAAQTRIEELLEKKGLLREAREMLLAGASGAEIAARLETSFTEELSLVMTEAAEEEDNHFFYGGGGHPMWQALSGKDRKELRAAGIVIPEIRYAEFYEHERPQDYYDFLTQKEDVMLRATTTRERQDFFRDSLLAAQAKSFSEEEKIVRARNKKVVAALKKYLGLE